jgi:hypothetical protein
VDHTNIQPEGATPKLDDAIDTQAFQVLRALCHQGGNVSLGSIVQEGVRDGGDSVDGGGEGGSGYTASRGGALREQHAGRIAVLITHHLVGAGVDLDMGTGLACECRVYFVDALMGLVTGEEGGWAGDAVAPIWYDVLGVVVAASTDVETT